MNKIDLTEKLKEELKKTNLWEQEDDDEEDQEDENDENETEDSELESDNENNLDDSSDVKLYKLSDKVVKLLTARLKDEYTAHYFYRAAANWCNDVNYKKAAAYFENEANDELTHAQKIQDYMTGFNIIPQIPVANPKHNFNNLINIVNEAYQMELNLMNAYNKVSHVVFTQDITTFDFLTELREIQKNSVVEYNDLINASNLVDKNDKFQVLYFEQTYF